MVKRQKDNRTNKDLQNTAQKTKERATRARTPLKQGGNSGRVNISCFTSGTLRIAQVTNPVKVTNEMVVSRKCIYTAINQ